MSNWFGCKTPENSSLNFADIDERRMSGQPAVGFYRWSIVFYVAMHPAQTSGRVLALTEVSGDLTIGPNTPGLLVARFHQTEPIKYLIGEHSSRTDEFTVEAEMDCRRLMAIEELRLGGELSLQIKLRAVAVDLTTKERFPAEADVRFQATESDWRKVLAGMQFRRTLLVEVPVMEESKDPELAKAAGHLAHAAEQMGRGNYRGVVSDCRHAVELLRAKLPAMKEVNGQDEKARTKEQRLALVNESLFKLTHLAHHEDEVAGQTHWTLEDAQAVLLMTGALLRMAAINKDGIV